MQKQPTEHQPRQAVKNYFHDLIDIRDDMMSYEEMNEMMLENTVIHGANMWILMLAILIASIGLNVNSTAVIIGAMLISPLMSGIITMGYSLAVRDLSLLRRALTRFGTQVMISLVTSTLYFMITPLNDPTSEMTARISPTIWDVLIALFGGIAGMIGNTRIKKGNVIPGVAIATALMPPLCTAGYGIASLQASFFLGAFYLFIINTLFIMLGSAFITLVLQVPFHKHISQVKQRKINRIIFAITVITVIPSIVFGFFTVYNSVADSNISSYLEHEFVFSSSQVVRTSTDKQKKEISVSLVGMPISEEHIRSLEKKMENYHLEGYTLRITQNSVADSTDAENTDKVTIAIQENTIAEMQTRLEEEQEAHKKLEQETENYKKRLNEEIDAGKLSKDALAIFTSLKKCSCGVMEDDNGEYIFMFAQAKKKLKKKEIQTIKNWMMAETGLQRAEVLVKKKN